MATTILNNLILQASRKVQEYRTSAASTDDTGRRWLSSNWTDYTNRAIRDFLKEKFIQYGPKAFGELFPDYMKQSGSLTVVSGSVVKPSDSFIVTDLWMADNSATFFRIPQDLVAGVVGGFDRSIVPSTSNPCFYEEGGYIKTLGLTSGSVYARYIKSHADLAVITTANGNGKYATAFTTAYYVASTGVLFVTTMSSSFASGDENKQVVFQDNSGVVYSGHIASVVNGTTVSLYEASRDDGLPAANITAGNITSAIMGDTHNTDVLLNSFWFGEILDKIVAYAQQDAIPQGS